MSEVLYPIVRNVTLTLADTEYSQSLPVGTRYFSMQCRTGYDVRYAFITGKVATPTAPYMTVKSGQWYNAPEKFSAAPWATVATPVAEVNTLTIAGTWLATETCTITIDGLPLVVTIGSLVTTAQVATTIKQAWEGETITDGTATVSPTGGAADYPYAHGRITATVSGSVVTLTGKHKGERWNTNTVMAATETSAGGTAVLASSIAAAGPAPLIYFASAQAGVVVELFSLIATR